jgi:hypothetical protein
LGERTLSDYTFIILPIELKGQFARDGTREYTVDASIVPCNYDTLGILNPSTYMLLIVPESYAAGSLATLI